MNAPDEHWLMVKNRWLPIENGLDSLGATGEDAREKIDSLASKLNSSLIDQLHYLRMERNALIHKNRPLNDYRRWESTAIAAQEAIRGVGARTIAPATDLSKNWNGSWIVSLLFFAPIIAVFTWGYVEHGFGGAILYTVLGFIAVGAVIALLQWLIQPEVLGGILSVTALILIVWLIITFWK